MRAPNSYTREDTVEIDCHGGTLVMRRILEVVLKMEQDRQNRESLPSVHFEWSY